MLWDKSLECGLMAAQTSGPDSHQTPAAESSPHNPQSHHTHFGQLLKILPFVYLYINQVHMELMDWK